MSKLRFYNDTGKDILIHPATEIHGVHADMSPIKHGETREFTSEEPEDTLLVKQWSTGQILVSAAFGN